MIYYFVYRGWRRMCACVKVIQKTYRSQPSISCISTGVHFTHATQVSFSNFYHSLLSCRKNPGIEHCYANMWVLWIIQWVSFQACLHISDADALTPELAPAIPACLSRYLPLPVSVQHQQPPIIPQTWSDHRTMAKSITATQIYR